MSLIHPARIYECTVTHSRLRPVRRTFAYRVFMLDVDLDSFAETAAATHWLGHNRFNLFSIDDRDHIDLGLPGGIRANLVEWLSRQGVEIPPGTTIRLVTFPRTLGYGFNPVSFYYLHRANGSPLLAVAEVVNTYREMKLYIVDGEQPNQLWHRRVAKDFYVSPFSDPADHFDFRLGIPGQQWRVNIDDLDDEGKVLLSAIRGQARPLTSARLFAYAFKYPLLSLKIIAGIHWQALLLWLRRTPYFRKDDRTEAQLDVLRPHPGSHQDPS
ncbi:MAG: hypothetical protein JWO82_1027 [Akkermansiaceae bacterium]|nr:hypothetical protein [Akkermansiaceae bacterium]